jgi:hypothetical protein
MASNRKGFTCSPYELACLLQPESGITFTIGLRQDRIIVDRQNPHRGHSDPQ